LYFVQTGAIIEDGHGQTARDKQPVVGAAANAKSEAEKLEDGVGGDSVSGVEAAAESEMTVDTEERLQVESVDDKPTDTDQKTKTEPTEEIEVEVEEFYIKYKNL